MNDGTVKLVFIAYRVAAIATFAFLTFFDGYRYNWWNWIIALPANAFLGGIWPIYWFILRPLFNHPTDGMGI